MIALVGLLVVNIPFLSVMGLAAAGTVTIAVLIAITLLPAAVRLLRHAARRANRLLGGAPRAQRRARSARRWVGFVTRRPIAVLVTGLALLTA